MDRHIPSGTHNRQAGLQAGALHPASRLTAVSKTLGSVLLYPYAKAGNDSKKPTTTPQTLPTIIKKKKKKVDI